jgi:histidine triad (HIT) family protein
MSAWILGLARSRWGGRWIGWLFTHMSFLLPLDRLVETSTLVAFHHPKPAYPVHILIVPKRAYASLLEVAPGDTDFLADVIETVQKLVRDLDLEPGGYRLITNGGPFQEVKQLHFHLVGGDPLG